MPNDPIVPAPDTGTPTVLTDADVAAMAGTVTKTSGILGYADNSTHSVNALVELVYVRIGNEVMAQALSKLEGALSATQRSLDALTGLQGLQNMIDVKGQSAIPFKFSASNQTVTVTALSGTNTVTNTMTVHDAASYMSAYNVVANNYYKPIDPFFSVTMPGRLSAVAINVTSSSQMTALQRSAYLFYKNQLISSKARLSGLISALTPLTPALPGGGADPTTLLAKLKIVYGHLPSTSRFSSVRAWILDGYTSHNSTATANQGIYQQEITNAIVAGESLNSSQNAAVRRYMFIFEQYYQSATSIISSLNQLMSNIARKVSGG